MQNKSHFSLLKALWQIKFITPKGLFTWGKAIHSEGVSLMALLRFSAETYPNKKALNSEGEELTYLQLLEQAYALASHLQQKYGITEGSKVALLCRNHTQAVLSIFAVSRLGAHLYLLNSDLSAQQLSDLSSKNKGYQLWITDSDLPFVKGRVVTTEELSTLPSTNHTALPKVARGGIISVLSGGSSGHYTEASRKPSTTAFLPPLLALLRQIGIHQQQSVYIPLPLFHGFGLATLLISLAMGKQIWLTKHFSSLETLHSIKTGEIEVLIVVPSMIPRLLQHPNASVQLASLQTIITGGDRLTLTQAHLCLKELPNTQLFNLYGTSEAGFFMLATSEELRKATTEIPIGRPIKGVACKINNPSPQGVGELWVASKWAMSSRQGKWQATGDLVYRDPQGLYYHRGRADRMVVCGGENIHLDHVEMVVEQHPLIATARAFTIDNPTLGNSIGLEIELIEKGALSEESFREWIKEKVPYSSALTQIVFREVVLTSTGKRPSSGITH